MLRIRTLHGRRVLIVGLPDDSPAWRAVGESLLAILVPLWLFPLSFTTTDWLVGVVVSQPVFFWAIGTLFSGPVLLGFRCLPSRLKSGRRFWAVWVGYAGVMGLEITASYYLLFWLEFFSNF